MIGPHQSSIASLTGTGQGPAPWMAKVCDDRSWARRSASSSRSRRTNIVGTHWLWVTRYRSMAANAAPGSKRSMTTVVAPIRPICTRNVRGAEWYSGAVDRYTEPGPTP